MPVWTEDSWVQTNPSWIQAVATLRTITNTVGIITTSNRIGSFIRLISNTIVINMTTSKIGTYFRIISNTVGITEVVLRTKKIFRQINDIVGITTYINVIKLLIKEQVYIVYLFGKKSMDLVYTGKHIVSSLLSGKVDEIEQWKGLIKK